MSKALEGFRAYQVNKEKKAKRQGKTTELTKIYDSDIQAQPQLNQGGTQAQTVSGSPLDAFKSERGLGNLTNAGREWYANRAVVDKQRNDALRNTVRQTLPAYQRPVDPITAAAAEMLRNNARGNIDLYNRPQYRQPDGSISTVNSISIGTDEGAIPSRNGQGLEVLIPTIGRDKNGRPVQWTDQQAIDNYFKTGEHLGKFRTPEEADQYAERLHRQQEAYYDRADFDKLATAAPHPYEVGDAIRKTERDNKLREQRQAMMEANAKDEEQERLESIKLMQPGYVVKNSDGTSSVHNPTAADVRPWESHQDDPIASIVSGVTEGSAVPSLGYAVSGAFANATNNKEMQEAIQQDQLKNAIRNQQAQERHPIAYGAGSIAGTLGLMAGIGGAINAGVGAAIGTKALGKVGSTALKMGVNALNFAAVTAAQESGAAVNGLMTPEEYAKDVLVSGGGGLAMSVASMAMAGGIEKILTKTGNQTAFLDFVKNVTAATSGSAARIGVEYGFEDKTPTERFRSNYLATHAGATEDDIRSAYESSLKQKAAIQFGTAFCFNLISSYRSSLAANKRMEAYLREEFDQLEKDMETLGNMRIQDDEIGSWKQAVNDRTNKLRTVLQNNYFAGQQDKVDAMLSLLDEIDDRADMLYNFNMGATASEPGTPPPSQDFVNAVSVAVREGTAEANAAASYQAPGVENPRLLALAQEATAPKTDGSSATALLTGPKANTTTDTTAPTTEPPALHSASENTQMQSTPGNPYARTAGQDIDNAARQIQAAEYEKSQHPSVEQLNDELNSPFAVFENENPEIAQIQTRTGEQKLAALAAQATENQAAQKRDQIQAIYEAGKTQNPDFQTVMDSATMLTEAEKTDAFYRGLTAAAAEAAGIGKEISYGGQQQEEGNYLSGEGSGRNLPLSAGERDGGVSSEAGGTAEDWQNWTAAADPDLRGGSEGTGGANVTLDRGVLAEEVLRTAAPGQVIYPVKEGGTPKMRKAQARINAYDPDITQTPFVSKGDLLTDKGEYIRAFVDPAKRQIGFRINDEQASSDKVGGIHEVLEIANIDGKLDLSEAEDLARHIIPGRYFNAIVKAYQNNGPTRIGIRHAIKEALFDITAGINQFEGVEGYGKVAQAVDYAQGVLYDYFNDVLGGVFDAEYDETATPAVNAKTAAGTSAEATAPSRIVGESPKVEITDKNVSVDSIVPTITEMPKNLPEYSSTLYREPAQKELITLTKGGEIKVKEKLNMSGRNFLIRQMKEKGYKDKKHTLYMLDKTAELMDKAGAVYKYIGMDDINNVRLVIDPRSGNIVLRALVKNGEYPVNLDLTKECTRRIALGNFIKYLAEHEGRHGGKTMLEEVPLTAKNLVRFNQILKDEGFDTACLGCFVETRRYRIQEWADSFIEKYNRAVEKYNPDAGYYDFSDKDIYVSDMSKQELSELNEALESYKTNQQADVKAKRERLGQPKTNLTNEESIDALVRSGKAYQKKLRVSDLITPDGRTALHRDLPELESLVLGHYGSNTPKSVELFTPYNYDLGSILSVGNQSLQDYVKPIGGVREQSFSDSVPTHLMDQMEKTADLAVNKLVDHTYTKVPSEVMMLGLTGRKFNMSIMFNIDPDVDSAHAGLRADGSYFIGDRKTSELEAKAGRERTFVQSFPYDMARKIQHTPGYSKNCGMIGVGYSYFHMRKMMDDPEFGQIIGYHPSGMNESLANMAHIDKATSYEPVQNTLRIKGLRQVTGDLNGLPSYASWPIGTKTSDNKMVKKTNITMKDFDMKGKLAKYGGPKTMKMFLSWLEENRLTVDTGKGVYKGNEQHGVGDFPLYADLAKTRNPKKTADNYITWCLENDMLPEFYEFADHDNYFKNLYDFTTYDHRTMKYSPQVPVTMTFPPNFFRLANHSLNQWNNYLMRQEPKEIPTFEKMYDEAVRYSSKLNLGPKYTDYDENVEKPGMNVSYSLSDDGKRIAISPESYMNDATWKKVHNAINRLGYGMPSVEITKQYVLGGYNLQPDQTEAVKKIFGISDGEPAAETDIKAAKATASKAAKHFGVTRDLKKAAYLTVNGTMLDFSEGQGRRTLDHRSISQILDLPEGHGYSAGMIEFMNQGNIRLQSYGIDISKEPNQAQRRVLRQIIEDLDGEFVLDISNERGDTVASVEYPEGTRTAKILADIDRYFKEGTIPEQDSVSQFHMAYSSKLNLKKNRERDMEYDAAVKNNDMESAGRLVKEAADQAGYKLAVYHGTGETFTEFNRGAEGIHVGNREQAEQIAKARFDHRSKTTQYVWGEIRDRVPEMDREQRDSLVSAAYTLGDYFDAGPDESWFDGDIMDDSAVTEYVDHMAEAYKKGTGREAYLRMRTFDRKTGENVMGLYAKINNPMVINGDIVSWTPADIADVLVARNRGEGKIRMWYRDKDTDISGSEIKLSEDDLQYIENIQRTNNEEGWDLLSDVLFSQGYDGIQYRNEFEGDKQSWSYIALNPSDVKSADPITYNNAGNVIPLSERFNQENNDIRYSSKLQLKDKENDYAPTFYSKLQREIQNYKGEKIGAASVESYLKGKGVKDEEIKWSGIRTFLESKKSVSKQELMDYLKANELVIEEKILGGDTDQNVWSNGYNTVHIDRYYDPVSDTEFKGEEDFRKEAIKRAAEDHIKESEIYFNISNDYMSAETEDGDMILEAMLPDEYELRDADYEPSNGTRWGEYILDGGANYREILFSIPGSDYTNQAMQAHWRSDTGVLAHARVQDFESNDGGKVLFVEEIQSDWHNAGQKNGYQSVTNEDQAKRIAEIREDANNVGLSLFEEKRAAEFERIVWKSLDAIEKSGKKLGTMGFRTIENSLLQNIRIWGIPYDDQYTKPAMDALTEDERLFIQTYREDLAYQMERETEADRAENAAPDAPFRNNYTDFVLKDLLHMAAEGEYDYLAWTTGKMQEERWSDQYAEGYRIEYDQQVPKFLKKYGRQWGAGLTEIGIDAEGPKGKVTSAPAIVVNDAMKKSVLTEGQPMYSTKLNLNGREVELTDREEELMDQLNSSYLDRIDEITQQKDAEIAALQEKMERAVGEEKKKARDRLERLRKQKNDRIAYLEKQWRENTNRRIADLKEKAKNKLGEQHDDMMRRLAKLQAQKDKKIEDILAEHRRQRQEARDKRNDHKLRVKFQKLAQRAVRDSKNKPGMASQRVQELLKDIDLKALGMRDETKWELRRKYQEILEMKEKDENYAALFADRDMKKVERLFKTQINEMSVEDINDLITELSALAHYQENTDRLLKDSQGRSAAEVGRQIVKDLKELSPLEVTNPVKRLSAKYLRDNLSPERAFNRLSGYKHDNAMKAFYRTQVLDGLTKVKRFEQKADELKQEFINDEKNKYFLNNGSKQTIPVTDKYGRTAMISPAMRVSLYMASKNTDNLRHIATDGVTVPEPKTYAKGMIEDAYGRGTTLILDPTDVKAICNGMTDSEKEFATLLKIFFDTYAKDAINETSVDLDGILRATVENYFPITSDKNFLAKSMDSFQDPTLEGWNNLKSRQENANNRILLEDARQVLQRHIRNTARYHGLAVPMRNWSKVYGYTSHRDEATGTRNSVQSAIKNAWDADTADYIERLIRDDINSGGRKAERGIADAMRSAYAGATLTLNPSVALKQTTSYLMAGSILDSGSLMYGLAHGFTKKDEAYMDSITPWGWARRQGESTIELGDLARKMDPITKNTPNWNQAMDVWTTNRLFLATEESVKKEFKASKNEALHDLKRGDKKYDDAVAERYNQVLWRTQPQYEAAFRPEYLRKTDVGSRTFGMFKTESMQMSGELIDSWGQWRADSMRTKDAKNIYDKHPGDQTKSEYETNDKYRKESAKQFYRTFTSWVASNMLFAIMGTALNIGLLHKGKPYRNEKGEIDFETIAKKTALNFAGSSLGGFFYASTAADIGAYLYGKLSGENPTWYDIEVPGISLMNDAVENMGNLTGVLTNEEANNAAKAQAIAKFALAVSKFTPVGFAENIVNLANSVVLYSQDVKDKQETGKWHPYEAGKGLLKDTSPTRDQYANMAVDAARKGDMATAERALKKTKKANLEKAVGRPITENMYKKIMEDPNNLRNYLGVTLEDMTPSIKNVPDHGYSSFTKLREDIGDPERTQNWHHIVEQEQMEEGLAGFKSTQVNNTNNIVSIPSGSKSPHSKISEYYGSVQDFTDGKTVREWLKDKSFEEQWEFGVKQLREYGDLVPTTNGWVFVPDKEKMETKIPMSEGKAKEKTGTQRAWESRIAEAREDGSLKDNEIRTIALDMIREGISAEEAEALYRDKKKKEVEKLDKWIEEKGTFEDYLKGRNAISEAAAIKDKDKEKQAEKKKKAVEDYLRQYHGSYANELWLWELAGYSENTFEYH